MCLIFISWRQSVSTVNKIIIISNDVGAMVVTQVFIRANEHVNDMLTNWADESRRENPTVINVTQLLKPIVSTR